MVNTNETVLNLMIQINAFIEKLLAWRKNKEVNILIVSSLLDFICGNITENELRESIDSLTFKKEENDKITNEKPLLKIKNKLTIRNAVQSVISTSASENTDYLISIANYLYQQQNGKIERLTKAELDHVVQVFILRVHEDSNIWEKIILDGYKNSFNLIKTMSVNISDVNKVKNEKINNDDANYDDVKDIM